LVAKTCNLCGELKMARCFSKINGMYHNSWCKTCQNHKYKHNTYQHQARTLSAAVRHRQPWTEGDLDRLAQMVSDGLTTAAMAVILKRSVYSVNTMRNKLKRGIV
jgi:hypothetical protein